ncbi:unnamed protein product (macronuclear) [Paramecium tetraurelia]|uniref:Protein kinase domain-containing protein n=1 Tax=Paramecium tetraurelia TaxID=5888 RepID=A0CI44_PARTE|nr:uncharacterized protein GSPATT00038565001 [Paramecium tetraurelia]CAK70461.1 unnamed protein product [Paramecium tetraurelia]|eukprot:XP_001437858.1 hypothetical protein (macronuclear) [Paramecium tetraurelia strain d4-2]
MPPKKQHHKTQSSDISAQAIINFLSNRDSQNGRQSPTKQLDLLKMKTQTHQSPQPVKVTQQQQTLLQNMMRQSQRKLQQPETTKSRIGLMSPKVLSQIHMKTQPHSHQNSQVNLKESMQQLMSIPLSATSKVVSKEKKLIEELLAKTKNSKQQSFFPKSPSIEQKFQTHSGSQPLIFLEKFKPTTARKQEMMTIVLQYKNFRQKYAIDISMNKIQWLIDFVKQELGIPIQGIRTTGISIPVDFILSKPDKPLSLLSGFPIQPLQIEPIIMNPNEPKAARVTLKDFEFIRCIGMGGFSKVYMVREMHTGQFYAMKLIEKKPILQQNKQQIIQQERDIMSNLDHPFIVGLQYAFESRKYLVFVLEYCFGGELFYLLRKVKRMNEQEAFFYFAEICLGMKHLHDNNIIYRDIKPENILIDFDGHVRIADFGLSKPGMVDQEVAYSFCGSPEYMAPEMLLKAGHTIQLDLYCLGALLYELVTGLPPFYSRNTDEIYQRILNAKLTFPQNLSASIKDLLNGLLAKNPKKRIESIDTILRHPWMIQWGDKNLYKDLLSKKIEPPFKPDCFAFNFDEEEFGKGEAEFLQYIKPLQQNVMENYPKDIILKNFYYNCMQESTGGTMQR